MRIKQREKGYLVNKNQAKAWKFNMNIKEMGNLGLNPITWNR